MPKLTRNSLKHLCRICLCKVSAQTNAGSHDLRLLPRLSKLMIHFTSLDMDEEQVLYPKRVCQCCMAKLIGYQEFRRLALQSTETLCSIVNGKNCNEVDKPTNIVPAVPGTKEEKKVKLPASTGDADYDDQLLLPELAINVLETIKSETIDIGTPQLQAPDAFTTHKHQPEKPDMLPADQKTMQQKVVLVKNEDEQMCVLRNEVVAECDELEAKDASDGANDADHNEANTFCNAHSSSDHSVTPKHSDFIRHKQVNLESLIRNAHEGHTKSIICPECYSSFSHDNQLRVHIQSKHKTTEYKRHTCPYEDCDAEFRTKKNIEIHLKTMHSGGSLIRHSGPAGKRKACGHCSMKFNTKYLLEVHNKRHQQIKEYVCKENNELLVEHKCCRDLTSLEQRLIEPPSNSRLNKPKFTYAAKKLKL